MIDSAASSSDDLPTRRTDEFLRVFRTAVRKAQQRNRELGVPNVYSLNGQLYYEWPDGELKIDPPPAWYGSPLA